MVELNGCDQLILTNNGGQLEFFYWKKIIYWGTINIFYKD